MISLVVFLLLFLATAAPIVREARRVSLEKEARSSSSLKLKQLR
jgi:hypothetical protein